MLTCVLANRDGGRGRRRREEKEGGEGGREVVSFPDPTTHARKGSGDIGADSWFCKLSNHVIICTDLYWRTCGHVMVRKTNVPRPFSLFEGGVWERD